MSEMKKMPANAEVTELNEDELDLVAGGVYTKEEWNAMSTEERQAAIQRSVMHRTMKVACELD